MSDLGSGQTPSTPVASAYGIGYHGLTNLGRAHWNLSASALLEEAVRRGEGRLTAHGALLVSTGKHTSRAAADKFIVRESSTERTIWWGQYNRPFSPEAFGRLRSRVAAYLQGREVFVQDRVVGADRRHRLPIRIVTEQAWQSLLSKTMFLPVGDAASLQRHVPAFTVVAAPSFAAEPAVDNTRSDAFIIINFRDRLAIIGGTAYAGEIKKTIFTVMNYLLPFKGLLPMHSSANVGSKGDVAIFFGLSGTGKTTLSADPHRRLIGDDEHGWDEDGVFNFEGGCYAKVIRLSAEAEPQIYTAIHRSGAILENVTMDPITRTLDLYDDSVTENTRAAYPLEFIDNFLPERRAGHPRNIIFLTCDALGVMPPIAKLNPDQALYYFIAGYTSKIAGTEAGVGREPELTFSTCFGAPFMVHPPYTYAKLLQEKLIEHGVHCWLLNTGWTGGPYGVGQRISIGYTRTLLRAALQGDLLAVPYRRDSVFGFEVPTICDGIPPEILDPAANWPDHTGYLRQCDFLGARFIDNFKLVMAGCPPEVVDAGPRRIVHSSSP